MMSSHHMPRSLNKITITTKENKNKKDSPQKDVIHSTKLQRSSCNTTTNKHTKSNMLNINNSEDSERISTPPKLPRCMDLGEVVLTTNASNNGEATFLKDSPNKNMLGERNMTISQEMAHQNTRNSKKLSTISIYNPPPLVIDFIFKDDNSLFLKFQILFVKILLPHAVATFLTYLFMRIQISVNELCFLDDKCNCHNDFWIKCYTILRTIFTYWNLIFLLGYYSMFIIKELRKMLFLKMIIFSVFYACVITPYILSDGYDDQSASLLSYGGGVICALIGYIFLFCKVNFKCLQLKQKILYQNLLLLVLFSHLFAKRFVFNFVKVTLQEELGYLGKNISQIIISFYSFLYKNTFKFLILKFSLTILKEGGNYNAIIFFMRLIVCFIVSINTANIYEMAINDWGGWILIITYCVFLFESYTRSNLWKKMLDYLKAKLLNSKKMKDSKANPDFTAILSIKQILSGYLLDFQFIFIPRLVMLYYFQHLIDYHTGDYSLDCSLKVSPKFYRNGDMLLFIIILNIILPIIFFFWMHKKKRILFEFRFENYNFLQRTYLIFVFHAYFELIFQDFLTAQ